MESRRIKDETPTVSENVITMKMTKKMQSHFLPFWDSRDYIPKYYVFKYFHVDRIPKSYICFSILDQICWTWVCYVCNKKVKTLHGSTLLLGNSLCCDAMGIEKSRYLITSKLSSKKKFVFQYKNLSWMVVVHR